MYECMHEASEMVNAGSCGSKIDAYLVSAVCLYEQNKREIEKKTDNDSWEQDRYAPSPDV